MLCYVTWWEKILVHIIITGAFFFYRNLMKNLLKSLWTYVSLKREHRRSNVAENTPPRSRAAKPRSCVEKSSCGKVVVVDEQARPLPHGYLKNSKDSYYALYFR
ncbi:unnamed protein product [Cylicocyclus nassatus]|uniref:Uncharacterized protein n=1 Tax=Cylicocyclus nassatus TaxID=53992 RepID=A0AA36H8W1_CYLNA|nr:unnamed protein product [Cylicocyclus nassatus]